ncbi:MAG: GspE/PulE family protein [Rhodothermales bacterium]
MGSPSIVISPSVDPAAMATLPASLALRHRVVPLALRGRYLEVGVDVMPPPDVVRRLMLFTGKSIHPVFLPREALNDLLQRLQPAPDRPTHADRIDRVRPPVRDSGTVIERVEAIVQRAIDRKASDIHLEPVEAGLRVRYRIDGRLNVDRVFPATAQDEVVSRIKILSGLDIAERRRPQDGRWCFGRGATEMDIRVSSLPTALGEHLVLRLLDGRSAAHDLPALGFAGRDLAVLDEALHLPHGLILVTGPTGSGKTTTLYAALRTLNTPDVHIVTVEDPIEYRLDGVSQTQVHAEIGYTFARALRAFLRQDPNVMLVGEIRDAETAELSVRAALTGHLVLSTLHTNDAAASVTRLVDLGVAPFLVASSLRLVLAQRLVRRRCPVCIAAGHRADPPARAGAKNASDDRSCPECEGAGFRGRTAIVETLRVTESIARQIVAGADAAELRRLARSEGMRTLREAATAAVAAGVTTAAEAHRETSL